MELVSNVEAPRLSKVWQGLSMSNPNSAKFLASLFISDHGRVELTPVIPSIPSIALFQGPGFGTLGPRLRLLTTFPSLFTFPSTSHFRASPHSIPGWGVTFLFFGISLVPPGCVARVGDGLILGG